MLTIYKYKLDFADTGYHDLVVPLFAKLLDIQIQHRTFCAWYLVDLEQLDTNTERFYLYGTGWPVSKHNLIHVKTLQDDDYVWHIFKEN